MYVLFINFSIFLSIYLSIYLFIYLSIYHSFYLAIYLGYIATAIMSTSGGMPQVKEVVLFDGLYGNVNEYQSYFIDRNAAVGRFDNLATSGQNSCDAFRFGNIYTCCGGTEDLSIAMGQTTTTFLKTSGLDPSLLLFDQTSSTLTQEQYATPMIVKYSALTHDWVPRYYFQFFARQFVMDCGLV